MSRVYAHTPALRGLLRRSGALGDDGTIDAGVGRIARWAWEAHAPPGWIVRAARKADRNPIYRDALVALAEMEAPWSSDL